ncbi:hypothetical protein FB451DRAFT_1189653 [Mycena latifolia]|nr:hypothetical protein FB451DRAFT_1189653 [Mycena latifolia]
MWRNNLNPGEKQILTHGCTAENESAYRRLTHTTEIYNKPRFQQQDWGRLPAPAYRFPIGFFCAKPLRNIEELHRSTYLAQKNRASLEKRKSYGVRGRGVVVRKMYSHIQGAARIKIPKDNAPPGWGGSLKILPFFVNGLHNAGKSAVNYILKKGHKCVQADDPATRSTYELSIFVLEENLEENLIIKPNRRSGVGICSARQPHIKKRNNLPREEAPTHPDQCPSLVEVEIKTDSARVVWQPAVLVVGS